MSRLVGSSVRRLDADEKVSGSAVFATDIPVEGCLHGKVVRSPVPHGVLRGVHLSEDADWAGFTVVRPSDIPGVNTLPSFLPDQPFLADRVVKFAGDPVLLLAHADPRALMGVERHVRVDVDPLPACFDIRESLKGVGPVFGTDNVFWTVRVAKGDVDAAFASGGCSVEEGEYETGHQEQLYVEPQCAIAYPECGRVRVVGGFQCPYYVKPAVEAALGMPADVVQAETGGAFGGKEDYPSLLAAWAALLAVKSGRPVRMAFDRGEDLAYTTKRHPSLCRIRSAVSPDGRIEALDMDFVLDGGAYCTISPVVLSRGCIHLGSAYSCPNIRILGRAVATNTPTAGAFRGFGAPQAFFAMERHVDEVALSMGMDPLAFRRLNMLRGGDTTATSQPFVWEKQLASVLDRAEEESRYHEACREHAAFNAAHADRKRGVGAALFFHGCGFTGSGEKKMRPAARVELDRDGGVWVRVASVEMGQGARTVLSQMAADAMSADLTSVRYPNPDTRVVPNSGPTVASRTTAIVGGILQHAAAALRERVRADWGQEWADDASMKASLAAIPPGAFPLSCTLEYELPPGTEWSDETFRGHAYADYAWACYVAEVEADLLDYSVRPLRFTAVQDIGTVIHPETARGQVEGGVVQGQGYAFMEKLHMKDGRVVNPGFTDYVVPTAADVPEIRVVFVENPSPHFGFGAKGVGELPMDGVAPAMVNALSRALGVSIRSIPCTPSDLHALLKDRCADSSVEVMRCPGK